MEVTYLIEILTWSHSEEELHLSKSNLNTLFVQNLVISQNMNHLHWQIPHLSQISLGRYISCSHLIPQQKRYNKNILSRK